VAGLSRTELALIVALVCFPIPGDRNLVGAELGRKETAVMAAHSPRTTDNPRTRRKPRDTPWSWYRAWPVRFAFVAVPSHIRGMQPDLSPEDYAAIAALLREEIAADRFPLSPRVKRMRAILDKLEPPRPRPAPPPLRPAGEPSMVLAKMRGGQRRR